MLNIYILNWTPGWHSGRLRQVIPFHPFHVGGHIRPPLGAVISHCKVDDMMAPHDIEQSVRELSLTCELPLYSKERFWVALKWCRDLGQSKSNVSMVEIVSQSNLEKYQIQSNLGKLSQNVYFPFSWRSQQEPDRQMESGSWSICCTACSFSLSMQTSVLFWRSRLYADMFQQHKGCCRPQTPSLPPPSPPPFYTSNLKRMCVGQVQPTCFFKDKLVLCCSLVQWKHNAPQQAVSRRRFFFTILLFNYVTLAN